MPNFNVEFNTDRYFEMVHKAYKQAIAMGIKVNSIIINENMVRVKSFPVGTGGRGISILPEMICGLNVIWNVDELPENYSFALVQGPSKDSRLAKFEAIGMEPEELRKAAEIYRKIKEVEV